MRLRSFLLIILLATLLFSCTPHHAGYQEDLSSPTMQPPPTQSLSKITLRSLWTERFTGLLALSLHGHSLSYTLLDNLGVTLLSGKVEADGSTSELTGIKKLRESGLPGALATSLFRIYLTRGKEQCSQYSWSEVCKKKVDDKTRIKYSRKGPFPHWEVHFNKSLERTEYMQQWFGFSITLEEITNLR